MSDIEELLNDEPDYEALKKSHIFDDDIKNLQEYKKDIYSDGFSEVSPDEEDELFGWKSEAASETDIIKGCMEPKDNEAYSDSIISFTFMMPNDKDEMVKKNDVAIDKSYISFIKSDGFMEVDIEFPSHEDPLLRRAITLLNDWKKACVESDEEVEPYVCMTIIPLKYNGRYMLVGEAPLIYSLCSNVPNRYPSLIKLIFEDDYFGIIETSKLDAKSIMANTKRELDMIAYMEKKDEEQRKRIEYEDMYSGLQKDYDEINKK